MAVRDLWLAVALTFVALWFFPLGHLPLVPETPSAMATEAPPPVQATAVAQSITTPPGKGQEVAEPSFSMTDPDGQGLELKKLDVRAAIHGMLTLTEYELVFHNPHPRQMEGRFTAVLPPGAAISRFAKEVGGELMEGEVVERLRANQVYQEILHEMRDPALLEQDQGNRFQARIFPIPAGTDVRLVLSYSVALPSSSGVRTFTVPLRGLPRMAHFGFHGVFQPLDAEAPAGTGKLTVTGASARARDVQVVSFEEKDWQPAEDLSFAWKASQNAPPVRVVRSGDFYVASVRPQVPTPSTRVKGPVWIYMDTSASAADGGQHRLKVLEGLLKGLPPDVEVYVFGFDHHVESLLHGKPSEVAALVQSVVGAYGFLGATDLEGTLKAIAQGAAQTGKGSPGTLVLVSDAIATLGDTKRHDLEEALRGFPQGKMLHLVVPGGRYDEDAAEAITFGRGRVLTVPFTDALEEKAMAAAQDLLRPLGVQVEVADEGAEWVFPRTFADVTGASELLVFGKLKPGASPSPTFKGAGALPSSPRAEQLSESFAPLLEREGWRAYLDHLAERQADEQDEAMRRAIDTERIRISTEHRVVCPLTTLLVLESERDYQRFGLDRRALADILTVGPTGIQVIDRRVQAPAVVARPKPTLDTLDPAPTRKEAKTTAAADDGWFDDAEKAKGAPESARADAPAMESAVADSVEGSIGGLGMSGAGPGGGGSAVGLGSGSASGQGRAAARSEALSMAAPAPAASAPPSAPRRDSRASRPAETASSREEEERDSSGSHGAPAMVMRPPRPSRPSWVEEGKQLPTPSELAEMRAAVKEAPRDRPARNRLTDALLRTAMLSADALARKSAAVALMEQGRDWQGYDPENPQVYEAIGEAALALGDTGLAARAFGSLADIAPSRPEMLGRAALLIWRADGSALGESLLRRAIELRPDLPNNHRHLALILDRMGRYEEAAGVLEAVLKTDFREWYRNVERVIREELGYVYRDWMEADRTRKEEILARARQNGVDPMRTEPLRITLTWDTDANDVDLHVVDPKGDEAWYSNKSTSVLELYEDVTQGYGPEVTVVHQPMAGTYYVGVNYFSAGPMGVSRGMVVVREKGKVEVRPFRLIEGGADMRLLTEVELR